MSSILQHLSTAPSMLGNKKKKRNTLPIALMVSMGNSAYEFNLSKGNGLKEIT